MQEREGKNDKEGSDDVERIGGGALLEEGQVLEDEREKLIASLSTYSFRVSIDLDLCFASKMAGHPQIRGSGPSPWKICEVPLIVRSYPHSFYK